MCRIYEQGHIHIHAYDFPLALDVLQVHSSVCKSLRWDERHGENYTCNTSVILDWILSAWPAATFMGLGPMSAQSVASTMIVEHDSYRLSMILTSIPAIASALAHMIPAGPAPMIKTSTWLSKGITNLLVVGKEFSRFRIQQDLDLSTVMSGSGDT